MSYYNTPEQPIDPPEMKQEDENALEIACEILSKIDKLYDKVETFFEELTVHQIEDILIKAQEYFEELQEIHAEHYIVEEDYQSAQWRVDEIEGWFHEKEDSIKYEDK